MDSIAKVFEDFGNWIVEWISYFVNYFIGVVYAFGYWLKNALIYTFEIILYPFITIIEKIVNTLNLDTVLLPFQTIFNSGGISYFASLFMLDVWLMSTLFAYLLRFVIRRLPVVG